MLAATGNGSCVLDIDSDSYDLDSEHEIAENLNLYVFVS